MSTHPSLLLRKILHVDMDAFYAAIEARDDPRLAGKPVVVGGRPDSRGVVCTASYEARAFGVRSAMACSRAARLCPQAIFLRPRFDRYYEVSRQVRAIMLRYSPQLEPLSLDEAFLDVTAHCGPEHPYARDIARAIREDIRRELGLTASAGVAPNKMLAKVASELRKPDGLSVIRPDEVQAFMAELPLARIPGVGPKATARLKELGLNTCGEVTALSPEAAEERLGRTAEWLLPLCHGLDDRPVEEARERKSVGHESTFERDLERGPSLTAALDAIVDALAADLAESGLKGRTVTLKVKFADFRQITRAASFPHAVGERDELREVAAGLLIRALPAGARVRLLGISLSRLDDGGASLEPTPLFG
jgi:DNA polymerase-4